MRKYRWVKRPDDYRPWKTIGMERYGDSIKIEDLENACPVIFQCSSAWMQGRKKWESVWYSNTREFFHRNIGCFTEWNNCESIQKIKNI